MQWLKASLAIYLQRAEPAAPTGGFGADRATPRSVVPKTAGRPEFIRKYPMYLVELESGGEQLYESVEALAAAIRANEIGPESRIFHRASSSWVSITVHPEYRRALTARANQPLPPLARRQWTFFGVEAKEREILEVPTGAAASQADTGSRPARRGLRAIFARALRRSAPADAPEHSSS